MEIISPVSEKHDRNDALYKATGRLIVHNLDKTKDAGVYKCWVEDDSKNRNSATLNVLKILGTFAFELCILTFSLISILCVLSSLQNLENGSLI